MTAAARSLLRANPLAIAMSGGPRTQLLRLLEQLTRNEAVAASFEAASELEAVVARTQEQQRRMLALMVGRRTTAQRRERRERQAREQRQSTRAHEGVGYRRGKPELRSGRRPYVFWEETGSGPALLLINGWTAGSSVWPSSWLKGLEQHFRVIRMDTRGSGLSRTAPSPFTMANLADDAADVLRAADASRATVLGLSMGGMIAQELALRHRGSVERLVLVATRPPSPAHLRGTTDAMAGTFSRPGPEQQLEEFLRSLWTGYFAAGFADRDPALVDELVTQISERPAPRAGLTNQARAMACWHGARRLATLTAPTVVVHGDSDPLSPVGNGMRLAQLIPGARYVELRGVGHLVPLEAGDVLADILLDSGA